MNLEKSARRASLNFLSASWLHRSVGLEGVAKACRIYQAEVMDKIAPKDAYKDTSWLKVLEPMP
jgi:hypothetical protein